MSAVIIVMLIVLIVVPLAIGAYFLWYVPKKKENQRKTSIASSVRKHPIYLLYVEGDIVVSKGLAFIEDGLVDYKGRTAWVSDAHQWRLKVDGTILSNDSDKIPHRPIDVAILREDDFFIKWIEVPELSKVADDGLCYAIVTDLGTFGRTEAVPSDAVVDAIYMKNEDGDIWQCPKCGTYLRPVEVSKHFTEKHPGQGVGVTFLAPPTSDIHQLADDPIVREDPKNKGAKKVYNPVEKIRTTTRGNGFNRAVIRAHTKEAYKDATGAPDYFDVGWKAGKCHSMGVFCIILSSLVAAMVGLTFREVMIFLVSLLIAFPVGLAMFFFFDTKENRIRTTIRR